MNAIYVRQSIDKKDSISIETQIEFCKKEFSNEQAYEVYPDKGFSGKNTSRPSLKKLLQDIERGKIKKVIVYRLDRISRSITDFANIMDILEDRGVGFVSANEKFDTSTPVGRAMLYIIMIFAQLERETIAERIKDNYYARGKNGVWLGGPAPMGYSNTKEVHGGKKVALLQPNDDLEIVKEIFSLYANTSNSLGSVAKLLRQKHGGMWNNIKLARIIHNPAYVKADADVFHFYKLKKCIIVNDIEEFTGKHGCSLYGKRDRGAGKYNALEDQVLALALHEGIIDSKMWLQCQAKADKNVQIKNTGKGKHSWLTSLVKCGYCGYGMMVKVYNNTKYWVCTGRYATNLCADIIATHYVPEVEQHVQDELFNFVDNFEVSPAEPIQDATKSNALKIELHKIDNGIENLLSSISASNPVLMKYINEKIMELDNKKSTLLEELNLIAITSDRIDAPDLSNWHDSDIPFKRDIAQKLISKVFLYNDKIAVEWKA